MQHMSGACSTFYFASIAVISRGTYKPASEAAELAMTVTYCQPDQVMIKLVLFIVAELEGSLLIQLNGETYPSDSTIPITDVGAFDPSTGHLSPDSSLVCVTSELNTQCCRTRDGGNVGEWLFPNGTMVPRNKNSPDGDLIHEEWLQTPGQTLSQEQCYLTIWHIYLPGAKGGWLWWILPRCLYYSQ